LFVCLFVFFLVKVRCIDFAQKNTDGRLGTNKKQTLKKTDVKKECKGAMIPKERTTIETLMSKRQSQD